MRSRFAVLLLLTCFLLGASRCASGVKPDIGMSAAEAGDFTGLVEVEGCGDRPIPGYAYCRKMEGAVASDRIFLVAPAAECLGEGPCVTWKIFFPDGSPTLGGMIPRGQTRVAVQWKDLVKRDTIQAGDVGFWGYTYEIRWLDSDGREQKTRSFGEIRMRVLKAGYIPLDSIKEDANFAWRWTEGGWLIHLTTGARTFVGKE